MVDDQKKREEQRKLSRGAWSGLDRFLAVLSIILGLAILVIVGGGYVYGWNWTGMIATDQNAISVAEDSTKTFWDWLDLLIIPVVLAIGGYLFTRGEHRNAQAIAEQRTQEEELTAYFDQIGQLLLRERQALRTSGEDSEVRMLARVGTLTILRRLDAEHNERVLSFLRESKLITGENAIIRLAEGDLTEADLSRTSLSEIHLVQAALQHANLVSADMDSATLRYANLSHSDLSGANLGVADLTDAFMVAAKMKSTGLIRAVMVRTNLHSVDMSRADLTEANLYGAKHFDKANISKATLFGAIMPDGEIFQYEDWIKAPGFGYWHSVGSNVFHNNPNCPAGNRIKAEHWRQGSGNKKPCEECKELNDKSEWAKRKRG